MSGHIKKECNMRKSMKLVGMTMVLVFALSSVAMAGGTKLQIRDKAKDGTCIAALKTRVQDKLKDGSCAVAALKTRLQIKDGSCTVAALKTRTRIKDGSCTVAADKLRLKVKDGSCLVG
jgi:hypothetical protein